jgi:hypothetical protein
LYYVLSSCIFSSLAVLNQLHIPDLPHLEWFDKSIAFTGYLNARSTRMYISKERTKSAQNTLMLKLSKYK